MNQSFLFFISQITKRSSSAMPLPTCFATRSQLRSLPVAQRGHRISLIKIFFNIILKTNTIYTKNSIFLNPLMCFPLTTEKIFINNCCHCSWYSILGCYYYPDFLRKRNGFQLSDELNVQDIVNAAWPKWSLTRRKWEQRIWKRRKE